jgi:hypothetical protein
MGGHGRPRWERVLRVLSPVSAFVSPAAPWPIGRSSSTSAPMQHAIGPFRHPRWTWRAAGLTATRGGLTVTLGEL